MAANDWDVPVGEVDVVRAMRSGYRTTRPSDFATFLLWA